MRAVSSIVGVTSCHHSSVWIDSIRGIRSRTIGIAAFSSRRPAMAFSWSLSLWNDGS